MFLRAAGVWRGMAGLAVVLGLAGCGGTAGGNHLPSGGSSASATAVPSVDGCTVLSSQELSELGLNSPGTASTASTEVGCDFKGTRYTVTLAVDPARTFDGYVAGQQNQTAARQIKVNGRRALFMAGSAADRGCSELLELGHGVFAVTMNYKFGQSGADPCGETGRIGQVVEPKLPK